MTAYSSEQAFSKELIENEGVLDALSDGQRSDTHDADPVTTTVQGGGDDETTDALPDAGGDSGNTPPRTIAKDDAFHLLQNGRRRAVLRYLLAHPEQDQVRMSDLAEEVAAWEHDTTVQRLGSDQRQRVYIALYQSHLPNLDDHGVIHYNQSRGVVETTPLLAVFRPFLEDGLDADTQHIALDSPGAEATPEDGHRPGLIPSLAGLFAR